ncbi:MAG: DUF4250 domain-containing protein [Lachnospiraceae bacterium]|nr:DUF4250 domain-containing protein [Lachnospiraceae bacterium]MBR5667205.1 DUF4250 domain-containing protein [Lachnospiraceae bacterium]
MPMNLPENPDILCSVINTRLRDFYGSLRELCDAEDISEEELLTKLQKAGYRYDESQNRFR